MTTAAQRGPIRIVRIISRLNVGGPAIQAIMATRLLAERGYKTTLARGQEAPREGNMDHLAAAAGVKPVMVPGLQREVGFHDLRALAFVWRLLYRERPQILHTHAAKGGTVGRLAALALPRRVRPKVIFHTFHGHSLTGYFSPRKASVFLAIERLLARVSTRLIAVSAEVKQDLVALGVARPEQIVVIPLGFDLERFALEPAERDAARAALRSELGIPADACVVTLVARLVPIKRVDRFLEAAVRLRGLPGVHFLIVGDGELADDLRDSDDARKTSSVTTWAGMRLDMPAVYAASDVVALTSDNEGTPVSLIEAQAAGLPVVSTRVGGVASVIRDGESGYVVDAGDVDQLASMLRALIGDADARSRFGEAGRRHVMESFSIDRLMDDLDTLYRQALAAVSSR